ncbi:GntR family transcriptional regulator [Roseivivax halodurans JCM 10272]|uniref:GntR family transcriptional regulator n=1 Tax=Roseivivax halodurans JCM 10272 TaxID=1449350 RepID=X7EB41_9RHOB|nr:FCD domain-containing protein [Roseivivax halodurans]ETX13309.1 GntR family transcriptional regulator [Roseivivax halodurans JCM 10272]
MHSDHDDLSIIRTVSLTSALERQLERLIVEGELGPGDRLNEIQLATRFGTSRGPLREATRSLEAKGFVEVIRNRGVFVRQLSISDAIEIYDVRTALFALAGKLLAERMSTGIEHMLVELVEKMEIASRDADLDAYYPLNLKFHDTIVGGAGNELMAQEYLRYVKKMHLFRQKSLIQGGGLEVSNEEHKEMLEALLARDPIRARDTHWQHVENAKQRMLSAVT